MSKELVASLTAYFALSFSDIAEDMEHELTAATGSGFGLGFGFGFGGSVFGFGSLWVCLALLWVACLPSC